MKIIDEKTASYARASAYLHGLTGMGKSTWATTGGRPLVILTEPKAASVLRIINPDAIGMAPESLDDLVKVFEYLGSPALLDRRGFDRIVLDSVTELTNSIPRWMRDAAGNRSILTKLEIGEFGDLKDYAMAMVKAIQLTGLPSVIIARSTSKKVGLAERIVPDGTGSAVGQLPGKLLPTAESRFDDELGWVIDTTPSEWSQRCGLPWLPPIWTGSCLDFLAAVEGKGGAVTTPVAQPAPAPAPAEPKPPKAPKPAAVAPPPAPAPATAAPAGPSPEFVAAVDALNIAAVAAGLPSDERVDLVKAWTEKSEADIPAIQALTTELQAKAKPAPATVAEIQAEKIAASKAAEASPAVAEFVDQVAAGPGITDHEWRELLDLCEAHKINQTALHAYCLDRGHILPGRDDRKLGQLKKAAWSSITGIIANPNKRHQIVAAIENFTPKSAA